MKVFLYSSPYKYYKDNLLPLAKKFKDLGHDVYMSHSYKKSNSLKDSVEEVDIRGEDFKNDFVKRFLIGELRPDAVVLTQAWWFLEDKIVKSCNQRGIPFYILDHAAPVISYTEKNGKKSHMYRNDTRGARSHIVWGRESFDIMRKRGCSCNMNILGSPRVETFILKKNSKKIKSINKKYGDKIAVFYNTNNKMLNKSARFKLKEVSNFFNKIGYTSILKPHVRSDYNKKKLKNFIIFKDNRFDDELIYAADVMLFTFPSSVMMFGAIANKPIISLYGDHWSKSARLFSNKNSNIFLDLKSINQIVPYIKKENNYSNFVKRNIKLKDGDSASERIVSFIINDIRK